MSADARRLGRPAEPGKPERGWLARIVALLVGAATENWGTKFLAFLLALIVFIVTRDEVTRSFTIPLRIVDDPDRVLLTEPPATVEVRLRGPWANVNRITGDSLGPATLDLREVKPGPMALDPASIVMPQGVVLDTLDYAPIDLRFEDVIERGFAITPNVTGQVDPDYVLIGTRVEPDTWPVRGPSSAIAALLGLTTETVDIDGARADVEARIELASLPAELGYLRVARGDRPEVRFVAEVEPKIAEVELVIATDEVLRAALPDGAKVEDAELPATEPVTLRGPKPALRELVDLDAPVVPRAELDEPAVAGGALAITLHFEWAEAVPEATRAQLSIVPPRIRLRLAAMTAGAGAAAAD